MLVSGSKTGRSQSERTTAGRSLRALMLCSVCSVCVLTVWVDLCEGVQLHPVPRDRYICTCIFMYVYVHIHVGSVAG